ncbi:MAG: metallopeptidase family protein [Opitutaceae bacterium]|jgi:predicted Zn-dependent protease with MMP-like domain
MRDSSLISIAAGVVEAMQRRLPRDIRALARSVRVHYEGKPGEDILEEGFEPDLLGLFVGDSHGMELAHDNPMPPQIILYLENLWDYADSDLSSFRDEVRITYLHELGHYLGWDEDEITARNLD